MTTNAARFTGSIPQNYDRDLGPHFFAGYAADLARRVSALGPQSVLELAAGSGIVSRELRNTLAADCTLLASDLNGAMLEVAKAKFETDEQISFEEVDATDLRFDDASFDVVACQFGVMFFPDKDRSYAEVRRVLRPGGSYVFNVWGPWEDNRFAQIGHELIGSFFPDDPPGFYKVPFGYHDTVEIGNALERAGFTGVNVETVNLTAPVISPERLANGMIFGNPVNEEIVARGGNSNEVCSALAEAIDMHLGGEIALRAIVIHAQNR
jgi:SAM-dependent methyltransferase